MCTRTIMALSTHPWLEAQPRANSSQPRHAHKRVAPSLLRGHSTTDAEPAYWHGPTAAAAAAVNGPRGGARSRRFASLMPPAPEAAFGDASGKLTMSEEPGDRGREADAHASWRAYKCARAGDELVEAPERH